MLANFEAEYTLQEAAVAALSDLSLPATFFEQFPPSAADQGAVGANPAFAQHIDIVPHLYLYTLIYLVLQY